MEWLGGQARFITTAPMPAGLFDQAKFQIHRFTPPESNMFQNDSLLRDFAVSDRPTVIIEGTLTDNGRTEPFTYRSDVVANINLNFMTPVEVNAGNLTQLLITFDPVSVFRRGNTLLDPRETAGRVRSDIDNGIRFALGARKK